MILAVAIFYWIKKKESVEMTNGDYFKTLIILALMLILGVILVTIFSQAFTGEPFLLGSVSWNGWVSKTLWLQGYSS